MDFKKITEANSLHDHLEESSVIEILNKINLEDILLMSCRIKQKYKKKEKPNYFFKANPRLEVNENIK